MDPLVSAVGVTKRYVLGRENYVDALRGASVEAEEGEMVAIMGPSGSGKSTLLHIVGCLDRPNTGEIWLRRRRVDTLSRRALTQVRRKEVGFIFQGFNLVQTLTAAENVALAAEYAGHRRREALRLAAATLERVGVHDRATHRPNELSGGEQQRVAIARALVNNPAVILGDEPTGNLDTGTSRDILETMKSINQSLGITFILVTHDPDVAGICNRVIRMRDGLIVPADAGTEPAGAG